MELWWSEKVAFRRVTGRNLGEFGGLRCREFPKEVKLGSVGDFRVVRSDSGMDLAVEWRAEMVVVG